MKKRKVTLLLILLFLSACSGFYSEYRDVTPTVFPSPTLITSPSFPVSTKATTFISPTEICEPPTTVSNSETSPNGEWHLVDCKDSKRDGNAYIYIFNNHNNQNWKINYKDFESRILFGLSGNIHSPFHWSKNGESLYIEKRDPLYDDSIHPTGNILQINLATGQTYDLFSDFDRIVYTFSPDNGFLVYFTPNIESNQIYVLDLENQSVKNIEYDESYLSLSPLGLWSNDNQNFVATLVNTNGVNSLIVINAVEVTQRTLLRSPPDLLFPLEWKNQDEVMVVSSLFYNRFPEAKIWLVNIHNGEIVKIR